MQYLSETHNKEILIAETAYPFTLQWNDWTNNIVGSNEQLILPEYPATIEGQRKFIRQIKTLTKEVENGIGFCYWGAELISWKGNQSTDASPWENQAVFDFDNKALPVLSEF
jgi:arabinogalactan endo-1,4-beta-galactosidase